ncbi:MAG TPA: peptidase M28 family protein [Bacteroidetes bacterium]|nr:peptidase M28 family protein [Bacteroidota bacterium]
MNRFKKLCCVLGTVFLLQGSVLLSAANGQESKIVKKYLAITESIRKEGLLHGRAFAMLKELTTQAPSRLGGSSGAAAAVELTRQMMQDMGFDNVHLESIIVQRWVRGVEEAAIVNSAAVGSVPLSVCALGNSIGTPEMGITAPVVEVDSFDELHKIGAGAKGEIIFFNRPMDPTEMNTFRAYGGAVDQRTQGAAEGAKVGAVAVLVRSVTTSLDDYPHTGMMRYNPGVKKIPAAAISTIDANFLSDLLKQEPDVQLHLKLGCKNLSPVPSANVAGQITGTEKPEEIILMGGHLDAWELGTGAHDDGAGCVHALEAVRLIKKLGLKPKRTIRAVMFMNEEFGSSGGREYAVAKERKGEKHVAAIESDRGGFLPIGFGVGGGEKTLRKVQSWFKLFEPLEMYWLRKGGGGGDIAPLAKQGTVMLGLVPDDQRYFNVHHSANDILHAVNDRELELGAIAMAIMAYMLSEEGI